MKEKNKYKPNRKELKWAVDKDSNSFCIFYRDVFVEGGTIDIEKLYNTIEEVALVYYKNMLYNGFNTVRQYQNLAMQRDKLPVKLQSEIREVLKEKDITETE